MSTTEITPSSGAPSAVRRRLPWLIVGILVLVVIGSAVWALSQASDLSSANDARDRAAALLARSRVAERDGADRLAGKRQSAISPAKVGHQVVDLAHNELDLDAQAASLARQSIQAALTEDPDGYNAARDQLNSLADRTSALALQIDAILDKMFAPTPSPTA